MAQTPDGIPYPAPNAPADVPGDLKRLAEWLQANGLTLPALDDASSPASQALSASFAPNTWREQWVDVALGRPRFVDLPAVTVAATSVSALGAGYVTYKPAVVGTGANTQDWDGASDANIRYGGGPGTTTRFATGNGANGDLGLYAKVKPGGTSQAANWPLIYEFTTLSPQVEIFTFHVTGDTFVIEVNGQPVSIQQMRHATNTAGAGRINLVFPMDAPAGLPRRIRVLAGSGHGLSEIRVPSGYTIAKPPARLRKYAVIGDSWVNGSTEVGPLDSFAAQLLRMIDPDADFILAGIGGSGYTTTGGSDPSNYATRVPAVMASNPDGLILYGSQNDGNVNIGSAVASVLSALAAVPKIIVIPTLLAGYDVQAASIKAAAAAAGRTYLAPASGMVKGTGQINAPTVLDGNRSLLVNSAADLHMPARGHAWAARAIYTMIPSTVAA